MTTVTLTLSSSDDAPTFVVPLVGRTTTGTPIVLATMGDLNGHIAALAADDPNGTWGDLAVYQHGDAAGNVSLRAHDCYGRCDGPDHDYDADVTLSTEHVAHGVFRALWIDLNEVSA